jgi:cytochrome c peroxidase
MNRRSWSLITVAVVVVVAGAALPLSNALDPERRVANVVGDTQLVAASEVLQSSCVDCHAVEVARLPFYARLPPASSIIAEDQRRAERWWRIRRAQLEGREPFSGSDLGHVETALAEGEMPPAKYVVMHWGARLSGAERQTLRDWIHARRASRPEAQKMSAGRRGEPIQPVVLPTDLNAAKVTLGERLYHEKRLSGDDSLSCATCHALEKGGTDQAPVSTGIRGQRGPINAPTTLNASYALRQFWDGRARDLKEQAGGPVENPKEMGAKFADVVAKLQQDETYVTQFAGVYPGGTISKDTITDAIAEFERSLVTPGAPFDRYLAGDDGALDQAARRGYSTFKAAGCTECHTGPAAGGESFERLGIAADYFAARGNPTDADLGRFAVTHDERDRHSFKVPTLRNIAVTQPYFHDGSVATLEDAVRKMAQYQRGRTLTDAEVSDVVGFLRSLTGTYRAKSVAEL